MGPWLPDAHVLVPGSVTPTGWFRPCYDMSRKHSFFQRRGGHLKKATRELKNQKNTVGRLFYQNTRLWRITWFTTSLNSSCHQYFPKANLTVKHRTLLLGQEIPTATRKTVPPTQSWITVCLRRARTIHTHVRRNKNPEAGFKSGTIFKEKPFFFLILPHEPTNFWHSYIFKHLALIFVQKKVNTKTYVTMISLFAYVIY